VNLASFPWLPAVVAYLVAAIPTGLLLARARGIDLRAVGSGNIGATNAVRALGPRLGLLVFALDVTKAFLPVAWAAHLRAAAPPGDDPWVVAAAVAAVLGHVYPVYLRFRGGKGVACALGVTFALDPPLALAGLFLYLETLWLSRTSALGSLVAVPAMVLAAWIGGRPLPLCLGLTAIAAVIAARHRANIAQIRAASAARKASSSSPMS